MDASHVRFDSMILIEEGALVIRGTCTPADLTAARWTNMRPRRFIGMAGIVNVLLSFWSLWFGFTHGRDGEPGWLPFLGRGVPAYFALMFGLGFPYRIRRTFRQRKDLHRERTFVATPEGLRFASQGIDAIKPWSDYLKWREERAVLLLYVSDGHFQLIPKRFFEAGDAIADFRTLLENRIGKPS